MWRSYLLRFHSVSTTMGSSKKTNAATPPQISSNWNVLHVDRAKMTYCVDAWALTTQAKNKLAATHIHMERSMLNITYRKRKTNISVREKTKVTYVIESKGGSGYGHGTSAGYEITDGHCISPPGNPTKGI